MTAEDQIFEGFSSEDKSGHYSSKEDREERLHGAVVWIGLFVFSVVLLAVTAGMQVKELKLIYTGNSVTVHYSKGSSDTFAVNPDGTLTHFTFYGLTAASDGDKITLYYMDDLAEAEPATALWFWLLSYSLFGGIAAVSGILGARAIRKTRHASRSRGVYEE